MPQRLRPVALDELRDDPGAILERVARLPPATTWSLLRECEERLAQYQALRDALLIRALGRDGATVGRGDERDRFSRPRRWRADREVAELGRAPYGRPAAPASC